MIFQDKINALETYVFRSDSSQRQLLTILDDLCKEDSPDNISNIIRYLPMVKITIVNYNKYNHFFLASHRNIFVNKLFTLLLCFTIVNQSIVMLYCTSKQSHGADNFYVGCFLLLCTGKISFTYLDYSC